MTTKDPAHHFVTVVFAAFRDRGLVTAREIAAAGGPSSSTYTLWRNVQKGVTSMSEPREPTWRGTDEAAGWVSGTARRVWEGYTPTDADLIKEHRSSSVRIWADGLTSLQQAWDADRAGNVELMRQAFRLAYPSALLALSEMAGADLPSTLEAIVPVPTSVDS